MDLYPRLFQALCICSMLWICYCWFEVNIYFLAAYTCFLFSGACITSWKRFDGREALLVRPDATFKKGERINSGLTLAFPQYDFGGLPFDGFAGQLMWDVVHAEVKGPVTHDPAPSITLRCSDTEHTRKIWPHKFEMFYKVICFICTYSSIPPDQY